MVRYLELQLHRLDEVLACLYGWFSTVFLGFPLLTELRSGWRWLLGSANIRFLYCVCLFYSVTVWGSTLFFYFPSQIYNPLYSGVITKCVVG
jgi:hypothetical protein